MWTTVRFFIMHLFIFPVASPKGSTFTCSTQGAQDPAVNLRTCAVIGPLGMH